EPNSPNLSPFCLHRQSPVKYTFVHLNLDVFPAIGKMNGEIIDFFIFFFIFLMGKPANTINDRLGFHLPFWQAHRAFVWPAFPRRATLSTNRMRYPSPTAARTCEQSRIRRSRNARPLARRR